jgi:hypothetical protein
MLFLITYWWAVLIGLLVYWLPTFVALSRRASSWASIAWVNFLLGWTLLGWLGALAWAGTAQQIRRGRKMSRSSAFEKPEKWEPFRLR